MPLPQMHPAASPAADNRHHGGSLVAAELPPVVSSLPSVRSCPRGGENCVVQRSSSFCRSLLAPFFVPRRTDHQEHQNRATRIPRTTASAVASVHTVASSMCETHQFFTALLARWRERRGRPIAAESVRSGV